MKEMAVKMRLAVPIARMEKMEIYMKLLSGNLI
jgi:hypothetical protein